MFIFLTVLIVAISLSMDTFSLSLSYGMFNLSKKEILKISMCVGLFHFFMPLLGNIFGEIMLSLLPIKEKVIVGIVFLTISIDIIFSLFKKEDIKPLRSLFEVIIFSLTVSVDSFSTGIGLGIFNMSEYLVAFIFMIVSLFFTYIGFSLGKKLHNKMEKKAEIIGVILLFSLSLYYIFS